jgi:hypothetical protein
MRRISLDIRIATALIALVCLVLGVGLARRAVARDARLLPGAAGLVQQTVATRISYQGRLTDAAGNPLNGTFDLMFRLWDSRTAGSQIGSQTLLDGYGVADGLVSAEIDVPAGALTGQAVWLEVTVDGQPMSPRQEILPAPYALTIRPQAAIRGIAPGGSILTVDNAVGASPGAAAISARGGGATGVRATGHTAVHADSEDGIALFGQSPYGQALVAEGDAVIEGDLQVTGQSEPPRCAVVELTATSERRVEVPPFCLDRVCQILVWTDGTFGAFGPGFLWPVYYMQRSSDNTWAGGPAVSLGGMSFSEGGGLNGSVAGRSGIFVGGTTAGGGYVRLLDDGPSETMPREWTARLIIDPPNLTRATIYACPGFRLAGVGGAP